MKEFNLETIYTEIRKQQTVTDKLEYWLKIKEKYIDKNLNLTDLFGEDYKLVSPIEIPENIYCEHFANITSVELQWSKYKNKFIFNSPYISIPETFRKGIDDPEFTYWFLKYNARKNYEEMVKRFAIKLNSESPKAFIKGKLKEIESFEERAKELINELDIYSDYPRKTGKRYWKEREFCRITAGYYRTHVLKNVHFDKNPTVILFAEHIYFKPYLKGKIDELDSNTKAINRREDILKENMDYIKEGYNDKTVGERLLKIGKPYGYKSIRSLRNVWNQIYVKDDQ